MEPDEAYDPDNEEPQEVTFNCFALENAVRRNMSLWRSHGMTGDRRKYSTGDEDEEEYDDDDEDNLAVNSPSESADDDADDDDDDDDDEWCCAVPPATTTPATGICVFL